MHADDDTGKGTVAIGEGEIEAQILAVNGVVSVKAGIGSLLFLKKLCLSPAVAPDIMGINGFFCVDSALFIDAQDR